MKSAIQTTVLMGLLAAVFAIAAAWCYPWPERVVENAQVNKPLFEDYDTSTVRQIEITLYDQERTEVERLRLKRKGERWVIPQKSDFDVTGGDRVIRVAQALNGRTVLEVNSDNQNDHVEYGVVDPTVADATVSRSSLGRRLVLSDRNGQAIGSLIVGQAVKGSQNKHYARIPGKPTVYTIEFDDEILSVDFAKWTSPNLLGLPTDRNSAATVNGLQLEKTRLGPGGESEAQELYDIAFASNDEGALKAVAIQIGGKKAAAEDVPNNLLQRIVPVLYQLRLTDVLNQSKAAVKALRSSADLSENAAISALSENGFYYRGYENSGHQFAAANGKLTIGMNTGVTYKIHLGSLTNQVGSDSLKLLYQVMLTANVDESVFPMPEKPENADSEDAVKKSWLRDVKKRDDQIAIAARAVSEFNRKHSPWIYVMDETVVQSLLPNIDSANN